MTRPGWRAPVALSVASEERLRESRSVVAAGAVLWGALFGLVARDLDRNFGAAILVLSGALLAVPVALWTVVRRSARWLLSLGIACILYVQLTFLLGGLAAIAGYGSFAVAAVVGVACLAIAAWKLRRDVARFDAEWERYRETNEREVLDLHAGTYDLARRFVPLAGGGRGVTVTDAATAADVAGRLIPVVAAAAIGALAAAHGWSDLRGAGIAVLSPAVAVALTPVLAQGIVHLRRLRGYERQLGRAIVNR